MQSGLYIAVFRLAQEPRIRVGSLGEFLFRAGIYLYVGSAQKGLDARIERHGRKDKPLRWHIDYLSVQADMLGAVLIPGKRDGECELAAELSNLFESVVPHFGSSDCRCPGHLFYAEGL